MFTELITLYRPYNQMSEKLICIYNAHSGVWNAIADSIHKFVSPETYPCKLCDITHGYFREKKERHEFLKQLTLPVEFYHKDEVSKLPYSLPALPCILWVSNKKIDWSISGEKWESINSINNLIQEIKKHLDT